MSDLSENLESADCVPHNENADISGDLLIDDNKSEESSVTKHPVKVQRCVDR